MNPWLFWSEAFRIPTWYTLLMLGFAAGALVLRREAIREGIEPRIVLDAAFFQFPGALVGARLAHVIVEAPAHYAAHPLDVFSPFGGWVFYGGAAGGIAALVSYSRARRLDTWKMLDIYTLATALGLVFGRLGCMGAGCCYGRPADWPFGVPVPWAVRYYGHGRIPEALLGVPLHPAPMYSMVLAAALFVGLSWLRARQRFSGQVILAFLVGYGVGRSVIELFRADAERGLFFGGHLSTSQIVGLSSAVFALIAWRFLAARCTPSSSTSVPRPSTPTGSPGRSDSWSPR